MKATTTATSPATPRADRHHLEQCGICHAAAGQPCGEEGFEHHGRRWRIDLTAPRHSDGTSLGQDTLQTDSGHCRPTTESTYVWDHDRSDQRFPSESTREAITHRGACLGCGWAGPARLEGNQAVEDAHDHAWPGWRDLPIVPRQPHDAKPADLTGWRTQLARIYQAAGIDPDHWTQPTAPFRTARTRSGTRSHSTWHGGYDICGTVTDRQATSAHRPTPTLEQQLALW